MPKSHWLAANLGSIGAKTGNTHPANNGNVNIMATWGKQRTRA
jgi:hypothetical protein